MSSPFQKSFSAKSPITTSPLKAGGYASGVDGMRYVSPKQPENKSIPAPRNKKLPTIEKVEKTRQLEEEPENKREREFDENFKDNSSSKRQDRQVIDKSNFKLYNELPEEDRQAAMDYNMKTYGTYTPTKDGKINKIDEFRTKTDDDPWTKWMKKTKKN